VVKGRFDPVLGLLDRLVPQADDVHCHYPCQKLDLDRNRKTLNPYHSNRTHHRRHPFFPPNLKIDESSVGKQRQNHSPIRATKDVKNRQGYGSVFYCKHSYLMNIIIFCLCLSLTFKIKKEGPGDPVKFKVQIGWVNTG